MLRHLVFPSHSVCSAGCSYDRSEDRTVEGQLLRCFDSQAGGDYAAELLVKASGGRVPRPELSSDRSLTSCAGHRLRDRWHRHCARRSLRLREPECAPALHGRSLPSHVKRVAPGCEQGCLLFQARRSMYSTHSYRLLPNCRDCLSNRIGVKSTTAPVALTWARLVSAAPSASAHEGELGTQPSQGCRAGPASFQ